MTSLYCHPYAFGNTGAPHCHNVRAARYPARADSCFGAQSSIEAAVAATLDVVPDIPSIIQIMGSRGEEITRFAPSVPHQPSRSMSVQ